MTDAVDIKKRRTVAGLLGAASMAGINGAGASLAKAADAAAPTDYRYAFLAPRAVRFMAPLQQCVDVHAHFFNASDVTVEGYLEGPVAHSFGALGWLVKLLAKMADGLGGIAISAKDELEQLPLIERKLRGVGDAEIATQLWNLRDEERKRISRQFDELTRSSKEGLEFRAGYRRAIEEEAARKGAFALAARIRVIDENSLADAMYSGEEVQSPAALSKSDPDEGFYAERLLGFIGYMLASRWTNLQSYRDAMTTNAHSIGVSRVLGALVNFDRWLDGKVRSSHEDQLALHAELSKRSAGYMQPIMSYNPWTDIEERGRALTLIGQAHQAGFVGVKIYPANGFRAYGNAAFPNRPGKPTGAALDNALRSFWLKCLELDLPVMSHAGPSMGADNVHDVMGSPSGWEALLNADFWPAGAAPRLNLGHFGGDADHARSAAGKDWPKGFAALMTHARGRNVYADLGYWQDLTCAKPNRKPCTIAKPRLAAALDYPMGGGRVAADRVMFGTDWLMLAREKRWSAYPGALLKTIGEIAPADVEKVFVLNAKKCFPRVQ